MSFVDSHHHVWCPQQTETDIGYKWLRDIGKMKPFGDPTPIQRDYLFAEFLEESHERPLATVHVQCDPALEDPVRETAWISQTARENGHKVGIVGFVDLTASDAMTVIDRHARYDSFRGVRQIIARSQTRSDLSFVASDLLTNPLFNQHYGYLAEHGLSFDLQLYPEQMLDAATFISKHPDIAVIIDHLGSPYDRTQTGFDQWAEGVQALSSLPHVAMKLSGHGMYDPLWTAATLEPYFDHLMKHFGADRLMFGSNFPVDKLMKSYSFCLVETRKLIAGLSTDDQDRIMRSTANRIYRLGLH